MTVVAGGGEDAQSTSASNVPHCGDDFSVEQALPFFAYALLLGKHTLYLL